MCLWGVPKNGEKRHGFGHVWLGSERVSENGKGKGLWRWVSEERGCD